MTSRRIERRFLPSVRAASENANRKRIQDLYLEVLKVRDRGRGKMRYFNRSTTLCQRDVDIYVYIILRNRVTFGGRHFFFLFNFRSKR